VVEYAVVDALSVAEEKNSAALKVLPVPVVKLCVAVINSPKNDEHIACVFAMIFPLLERSCGT
jgi:hypothetical protein